MYKPLIFGAFVGSLVFAIAFGCGSPTVSDPGLDKTSSSSSTSSSGNTSTNTSTTSSSSSGSTAHADCSKLPAADPNAACNACATTTCCDQYAACENDPDCKALKTCTDACADNDELCVLTCSEEHDEGSQLGEEFGDCLQGCSACTSEVNTDAGGLDFADAF